MGNPASPALANIIMDDLACYIIDNISFDIRLFKIYVDDTLIAVKEDNIDEMIQLFNSYHQRIQFTIEMESEGKLPFLDLCLFRMETGKIKTSWYFKPSASGRILNFNSQHPMTYKTSIIKNMIWKNTNLSDPEFVDENLKKIYNILTNNDYPKTFIRRLIYDYTNKLIAEKVHPEEKVVAKYFKFPYINGLTQKIQKIVEDDKHKLAVYNIHTTEKLFSKLKDKVQDGEKTNVIYKINCMDCEGVYIGQTKQHLYKRIGQHKNDTKIKNGVMQIDRTALCKHRFQNDHKFDFENVKILDVENVKFKRNISEMIYITLDKNSVNERSDTQNLNKFYKSLLNIST